MLAKERHAVVRFGPYEADFEEGILRKHGLPLKLQGKPLAVLCVLLENAGKIVSRDELRHALWPDNTFVDFDKNLSTAVNKLRDALCDSASEHQYIETIPRKGYRFRASVEHVVLEPSENIAPSPDVCKTPEAGESKRSSRTRIGLFAAAFAAVLLMGVFSFARHERRPLNEADVIVLSDFENSTGDSIFDDTLKTALGISLRQSPYINVMPDSQVAGTLQLMARSPNSRLTSDVSRDLCLRAGAKAYLAEAIGSLGQEYVLQLTAVNCQNGATLAREQVTAASKDRVVEALGHAAIKLRGELGESLATVQRFDVPLEQATTSSIEALKAYSLAQKTARENGAAQSLPYGQRAIELDPNFAMAYEAVGVHYSNLAEPGRAGEYLTKAFQLREHASERERLRITAAYYSSATGELDKAAQAYREHIAEYPHDIAAYNNLGIVLAEQGEYEKALAATMQGIQIEPAQVTLHENAVGYLLALQHLNEARKTIQEQEPRKPDNYIFPAARYALAFFSDDPKAMAAQLDWFSNKPEYQNFGLALSSDTEAYKGHVRRARELIRKAISSAIGADRKETGAIWGASAAVREAAFGNKVEARRLAKEALKLAPTSQGVEAQAALAFARIGDEKAAVHVAENLNERFPHDTQIQSLWLPAIRAQVELNHKNRGQALTILSSAAAPLEFGAITFAANASGSCLYSNYLRGEAYLEAGDGTAAGVEFQEILNHSGVVWNCWTGALARLGLARANALLARSSKGAEADAARVRAIASYKNFLTVWKDADDDVPMAKEAKAELVSLQ